MEEQSTQAVRARQYKTNGRDQDELRRKRRDDEVQIRKSKRAEKFDRNRRIAVMRTEVFASDSMKLVADGLSSMVTSTMEAAVRTVFDRVDEKAWTVPRLVNWQIFSKLAELYCNRPLNEETRSIIADIFYKASFRTDNVPMEVSCDVKCISALIWNLSAYDTDEEVLCECLQSLSVFLVRSVAYRNLALDAAVVPEFLNLAAKSISVHMNRSIMWIVALFCEKMNQYSPDVEEIVPLLEIIASGICSPDTMIQTDATTATVSLADFEPIQSEISKIRLPAMLVENLRNDTGTARPSIIGAISSIIQTTSFFTKEMVDAGLLEVLKTFINVSYMSQEVCFILSNISAERGRLIEPLISSGVMREVVRVMESAEYRTRKEAAFAVCNCCLSFQNAHLRYMLESGMLGAFTDLLTCMDTELVTLILNALQSLLFYGEANLSPDSPNPVALRLEEVGCRDKIEFLCESECTEIYLIASDILRRYFNDDEVTKLNEATPSHRTLDETIDRVAQRI